MPRYAELVYNGFWFSPERLALQVGCGKQSLQAAAVRQWFASEADDVLRSRCSASRLAPAVSCGLLGACPAMLHHTAMHHPPSSLPFSPQDAIDRTQQFVTGVVRVKLYKVGGGGT